jgi:hypothetical protein
MSLLSLPPEISKYIFDKVNIKQRVFCRLVCDTLRKILDNRYMWDDVRLTRMMKLTDINSCKWLATNTKIFDNQKDFQLAVIQPVWNRSIDIEWYLSNYTPDEYFAGIILAHFIKYRSFKELKFVDSIIRNLYPNIAYNNIYDIFDSTYYYYKTKSASYDDSVIEWVLVNYLSVDHIGSYTRYINVYRYLIKYIKREYINSARLILKHCDNRMSLCMISEYLYDQTITKTIIEVFELYKPVNENLLYSIFLRSNQKSLQWFWSKINVIPGGRHYDIANPDYCMRSAKVAYTMIEYAEEFEQVKWIVDTFDSVLRKIKMNSAEVEKYIANAAYFNDPTRSVSIGYKGKYYFTALLTPSELINRMPYYIKAGHKNKLDYVLQIIDIDLLQENLSVWLAIASEYSLQCHSVISKYCSSRK